MQSFQWTIIVLYCICIYNVFCFFCRLYCKKRLRICQKIELYYCSVPYMFFKIYKSIFITVHVFWSALLIIYIIIHSHTVRHKSLFFLSLTSNNYSTAQHPEHWAEHYFQNPPPFSSSSSFSSIAFVPEAVVVVVVALHHHLCYLFRRVGTKDGQSRYVF